ncbi:PGV PGCG_00042-like protein [Preplasmiviricota sp. Gezel-14T]|uniref:PGV PGCG_00042-like protein n=1 Tax=Preplasmiviricota sp. Gezel-14T TaxID=1335638 RepID=UPI000332A8D5|nr:PGV PGCG_00042-like protein [Preplasmiviricota sp. Gezel-14T]AGM15760.1 PGV PGCG_00042-like protein [Preplasmiviricota sp. Gezel-14T]
MFMSPYKSATFDNELSSGGGGSDIGIDANNDLLGLRNLSTTQNITAGTLNTGQITGTGEIIAGEGSDLSFVFGNAKIGWTGSSSTFIGFSHKDQHGINTAALQQTATGTTALNAAAGENLWLSIQGVPKLAIAPNGKIGVNNLSPSKELDVVGEIKASGNITSDGTISAGVDTDKTHRLGYATIGNIGFNGNAAFGHSSRLADGIDGYALLATGTGTTYLHAKTGKDIGFRIGTTGLNSMTCLANGTVQVGNKTTAIAGAMLDVRGRIYADRISCSAGSDISCEFGMAVIGHAPPKVGTAETCDDSVIFAHKDFANCRDYAIKQTDTGQTFLNSKTGEDVCLAINNRVRLTVKAGHEGNVGIGIQNPTKKLEVLGDISCSGDLHATGNIGVGTSSPQGLLHLSSGISGDCVLILEADTDNSNENDTPRIEFRQDGGMNHSAISHGSNNLQIMNSVRGLEGGITLHTNNVDGYANAIERMRITPAGNVGIGLADPTKKLEVLGDISCSGFVDAGRGQDILNTMGKLGVGKVAFNGWAGISNVDRANTTDYALIQSPDGITILNAADTKQIEFKIADSLKMKLASNGFFGIGRATPTAKLDVNGNIFGSSIIQVNIGGTGTNIFGTAVVGDIFNKGDMCLIHNSRKGGSEDYALKQLADGATTLNTKTGKTIDLAINSVSKLHIDSAGKVGIGLTNPTEELDVAGYIKASGTITSSDDRLKHNEVGITNGLEVIRRLAPVVYDKTKDMILGVPFTGNFNGDLGVPFKREAGFIAQDVKLIDDVEFAVKGGDYTNEQGQLITSSFGINYNDLFTYGLAATKEIDAIISPYPVRFDNIETDVETFSLIAMGNKTDIGRHEARIDNIESDIVANAATAAANLLTLETNTATNRATDNAAANLLNSRVGAVEATISAYPNRFATIEGELLRINSIDLDVGTLKTDMTAVENWMNVHMATTGGDGERITTLETEVAGLSNVTFAKANETDLIAALYRITTLEVDLAGAVDDLTAALSRITALESEVAA